MAAVAQQKSRELLTRAAQGPHRVETGAHQIAHRLMPGIGNPYPQSAHLPGAIALDWLHPADRS